jgi:nitrogen fixation protein FixH
MSVAPTNEQHEQLAQWFWTLGIVTFFALQAVLWLVAITLTLRDPSFAVAPQYEQQAEQWDAIVAKRRASAALGWDVQFVAQSNQSSGKPDLRFRLIGRDGQPLNGADVQLRMFHCARAAEVQHPAVQGIGDGWYVANIDLDRPGFWKLIGSVAHGGQEYCIDRKERFDISGNQR